MAGLTRAQLESMLAEALAARTRTLANESYSQQDRALRRASLEQINADIKFCNDMLRTLGTGGARTGNVVIGYDS
jgi:hypothetical protein